jgi:hypothetical protein
MTSKPFASFSDLPRLLTENALRLRGETDVDAR